MMKSLLVSISLLVLLGSGVANAQTSTTRSTITFEIKNMGITTGGSLGGLITKINFNPNNLDASTIEASVDVNTINTENSGKDEHLRSADFFDVAHYPRMTLKSIAIKHKRGNNYTGTFVLTIKGKAKQVEIPFTYLDKGNTAEFKGTFKINRLDFGVGGSSMILSDEVTVNLDCEEASPKSSPKERT
jgi:polyisoprenoid-binding protein YceI